MKFEYVHPADQLIMIMKRIYDRGMTTMSGGNLSIKDDDGSIWITPAGVDKGTLTRGDIVHILPDGTIQGLHRPSSELPFHMSVYERRPDLHAVLHAHPSALVAFSTARKIPNLDLIPSVRKTCGEVAVAKYAVPGSAELGENIGKMFDTGVNIVLLENHGVCIGAKDLFSAFMMFETLEYSAGLEIEANKLGTPVSISPEAFKITQTRYHLLMDDFVPRTHSTEERAARRDMISLIQRSYKQKLFSATHGTYSVKLSDGSFIITPFGYDRAYLQEEDLVRIKAGMKEQGKVPSRAVKFHEAIYERNPEIGAVLLAHPMHVMAFAVTDATFDPRTIPESYILLRDIKKEPFQSIYQDPYAAAGAFKANTPAMIYTNDCVVTTGSTLLKAFDRLEVMEATANSILAAREIGNVVHITSEEVDALKKAFNLEG